MRQAQDTLKAKHNPQIEQAVNAFDGSVKASKALAKGVKNGLPESLLQDKGQVRLKYRKRNGNVKATEDRERIEATYQMVANEPNREWSDWLEVARRYEVRVTAQDRLDMRHTITLRLAVARKRTTEPIPLYRAYRIASYCIAEYYYHEASLNRGLDCKHCATAKRRHCARYNAYSECVKVKQVVSLDFQWFDSNGDVHSLLDTVADDTAIDLDQWLDAQTWLYGCPTRLVEIAVKKLDGKPLDSKDRKYLQRYRKQSQMSLL